MTERPTTEQLAVWRKQIETADAILVVPSVVLQGLQVEIDGLTTERNAARGILRALLWADERGQGTPWQQAMEAAHQLMLTVDVCKHEVRRSDLRMHPETITCLDCGVIL